jgi:hypothetical protein
MKGVMAVISLLLLQRGLRRVWTALEGEEDEIDL